MKPVINCLKQSCILTNNFMFVLNLFKESFKFDRYCKAFIIQFVAI